MPNVSLCLLAQLTLMLHKCNLCVPLLPPFQDWVIFVITSVPYGMIINCDRCLTSKLVHQYNSPSHLKIVAIISGAEDGIVGRKNAVIRRREERNTNGSAWFDTIPVTYRSYSPLSYVLLLPNGTDRRYLRITHQSFSYQDARVRLWLLSCPMLMKIFSNLFSWHYFPRWLSFSVIHCWPVL